MNSSAWHSIRNGEYPEHKQLVLFKLRKLNNGIKPKFVSIQHELTYYKIGIYDKRLERFVSRNLSYNSFLVGYWTTFDFID